MQACCGTNQFIIIFNLSDYFYCIVWNILGGSLDNFRPPVAVEHPELLVADKPPFSHELCFSPTRCHGKFDQHNGSGLKEKYYYLTQSLRPSKTFSIFLLNTHTFHKGGKIWFWVCCKEKSYYFACNRLYVLFFSVEMKSFKIAVDIEL